MKEIISTSEIDKLGVYELRELARTLGVASPTTKKIKQLKEEILKIYSGEIKVEPTGKRLGRPPKSMVRREEISDFLVPKEITDLVEQVRFGESSEELSINKLIFKHEESGIVATQTSSQNLKGYVRKTDSDHFYFWNHEQCYFSKSIIVYIPDVIVAENKIRIGDEVEALVTVYPDKNYAIAKEVMLLNDKSPELRETPIDLTKLCMPTSPIELIEGESMFKGGRALTVFDSRDKMAFDAVDTAKRLAKDHKVILVGCEVPPELCSYAFDERVKLFVSRFGDGLESSYNTVANAINHATSLALDNNQVVIVIYDILNILDIMKLYFESKNIHSSSGNQLVKSLFGQGRAFTSGASITTMATLLKVEFDDDFIKKDLTKVASCVMGKY